MTRWKRIKIALAVLLLAVTCIGGAELLACRFADPALYGRITNPVKRQIAAMWDGVVSAGAYAVGTLQKNEAKPLENQAVSEPDPPAAQDLEPHVKPAPFSVTALEQRDAGEVLTGGSVDVRYFNQADPEWAGKPYGVDTLGKYGCGPTAMAMAVSSLTGETVDPEQMAAWCVQDGCWARHGGSYLSVVNGAAGAHGLEAVSVPDCDVQRLMLELSTGKVAVALMGAGHFTKGGHFILLRGTTLDGGVLVADSNSRERSLSVWDPQLILDELSPSRNNGAPLWLLSPAGPGGGAVSS